MHAALQHIIDIIKQRKPEQHMVILAAILAALLATQALRCGAAKVSAFVTLHSLEQVKRPAPPKTAAIPVDKYDPIMDKGILGKKPEGKSAELQVFGILGKSALIGNAPGDMKPYELGASLPSGEKLVTIEIDKVILEKDGKKITLLVFPDKKPGEEPPKDSPKPPDAKAPDKSSEKPADTAPKPAPNAPSSPKGSPGPPPPGVPVDSNGRPLQ